MNDMARNALSIKEQRHQPWKIIEGLVSMGENYQGAKQHCPFMKWAITNIKNIESIYISLFIILDNLYFYI